MDLSDDAMLSGCLGGPNGLTGPACPCDFDFDGDADVDLFDFAAFQTVFTG